MQYFITVESEDGSLSRVPIDQMGIPWSGGGGVSRSRVRKMIKQNECCQPATSELTSTMAEGASEDLVVLGLSLTGHTYTFDVLNDPTNEGATLPTILSHVVDAGATDDDPDSITVTMDTTGASGAYILTITNECGCCKSVPFQVSQD